MRAAFEIPESTPKQKLSIVIPCYNEAEVIATTVQRLKAVVATLQDLSVELIFIDDGSRDATRDILRRLAVADPSIKLVAFARNFGHQVAASAGIDMATGDAVVLIDADLQDPPELIEAMVRKWREGFEVVYGVREERKGETAFKRFTAQAFYRVLNRLSEVPIPLDTGDFRLMDRKVADTLRAMPERHRFLRGMVSWIGFRQAPLYYVRAERLAGESKYPLRKMLRFAFDGITSFSTKPLKLAVGLGLVCALFALVGILYALYLRLFTDIWVEGWTALFIAVTFLGGVQLICVGILGEYIGRIYVEVKNRPLYIVQESIGFDAPAPMNARGPAVQASR